MVGIYKAQRESSVIITTTQLKGDLEHNYKFNISILFIFSYNVVLHFII